MTYANVVCSYGMERFFENCKTVGIDGIILPDVPFEEKEEFESVLGHYDENNNPYEDFNFGDDIDWLNAHHFDYRGLIEKGLALEAPEDMYGKKNDIMKK